MRMRAACLFSACLTSKRTTKPAKAALSLAVDDKTIASEQDVSCAHSLYPLMVRCLSDALTFKHTPRSAPDKEDGDPVHLSNRER